MAKLPSAADFNEGLPQTRGANSVQATHMQADLTPGRVLSEMGALVHAEGQKIDGLQAEEALSKIRQARLDLTMGEQGAYSVKGGGVLDPKYASNYKSQLETTTAGIMANLSPGAQARLKPHADREATGLQSDVLRHSMGEAEKYHGLVREGSAATAQSVGIAQWNDPVAFQAQMVELDKIAMADARRMGLTGESDEEKSTLTALRQKRMSPLLAGAVTAALDARTPEGVARAEELLSKNSLAMEPHARLPLGEQLGKAKDGIAVQTVSAGIVAKVAQDNSPTKRLEVAAMTAAIDAVESGGRHLTKGGTLTLGPVIESGMHKGDRAVGKHQIMPKVAPQDAKEAGLPWDEKLFYSATPEGEKYHDALQAAHVARIMKKAKTTEQFFASYVAGENGVEAAVAKYEAYAAKGLEQLGVPPPTMQALVPGRPVSFIDFMAKPKEVRDYVAKASKTFHALPNVIQPTSGELRAQLEKQHPGRPDLVKSSMSIVEARLKDADEQVKQGIDNATEQAYKYMDKGMGGTFESIPPSVLAQIPAKEQDAIRSRFTQHLSGAPRDNDPATLAWLNSDPQNLANTKTADWVGKTRMALDEHTWQRLDKQRTAILSGDTKSAQALNSGAAHSALTSVMGMLGLDARPKADDTAGQMRVNTARAVLDQAVLEERARLNRQLTDVEIQKLLSDKLRSQEDIHVFFGANKKQPTLTAEYADIPSRDEADIRASLRAQTGTDPTDAQVLLTYKQRKILKKPQAATAPRYVPQGAL